MVSFFIKQSIFDYRFLDFELPLTLDVVERTTKEMNRELDTNGTQAILELNTNGLKMIGDASWNGSSRFYRVADGMLCCRERELSRMRAKAEFF